MKFHQRMWMLPIAYWIGLASIVAGISLVCAGIVPAAWLLLWLFGHLMGAILLSVGLHRYFSHGAFKTNKFWHGFLAFGSILLFQGSPHGWATAHVTHHVHSDTDRDPHYATVNYLWDKRYRDVPMVKGRLRKLVKDKTLAFVHRYALLVFAAFSAVVLYLSPEAYLYGYLMAIGSSHLVGAVHQITSHKNKAPRNLPFMEWIFPACGEWMHKDHHEHSKDCELGKKWWHLDYGAVFIRMIRKEA